ncbi:urea ABC transporter substrate-binding protein [Clostridium butyricum]|jgi:urea transport system substrate-binding protein|uniref:Urea ABC transporter substrate-binding protein n=1 Tax=Clostridium butyricum TaxID=1492 RepID=A0A6L9EK94_CLOBU|nr:urea ABC transporter substrate-binding protein [Clostridium butyricum]
MSKRNFFKKLGTLALSASLAIACVGCGNSAISTATGVESSESKATSGDTIKVGILHSMSGTMAMSEMPMIDATKMAIDEINEKGGVLGKKIEYVTEDGASDSAIFAEKATKLLTKDNVATVFGCWTSASRKAVLPVFEGNNGLLWYPVQYEGLESSHNIMYTAPSPNQQAIPAIDYIQNNIKPKDGNKLKVFLMGSDYVYPRTTNTIIKAMQPSYNFDIVGEEYIPLGYTDLSTMITKIQQTNPDIIINTINGDSNVAFFKQYKDAGLTPDKIQTMSFSCYEEDIKGMGAQYADGHLFAWNYFQTLDTPENKTFVEKFKKLYGEDRVTGDPIENAYEGVYLWAAACEKAGSFNVEDVIKACESGEVEFNAPEGLVTIAKGDSHHTLQKVLVGKCNAQGQLDIVWETDDRVTPDPWLKEYDWAASAGLGKNS